jgi:hypothetical protein
MVRPISEVLAQAGLEVLGTSSGPISTETAWKRVIRGGLEPTVNVPADLPDELAVVEAEWRRLATEHGVLGEDETFLIGVPGPGAHGPWNVVRLTPDASLAENLGNKPGTPDFVTAARDAPVVLGVTTEENGTWLIVETDS